MQITRRSLISSLVTGAATATISPAIFSMIGPNPNLIRLSANENPYGPSTKALKAAASASAKGAYYPGRITTELIEMIAQRNKLNVNQVVISSGSNEALSAAVVGWGKQGEIVSPSLTYDLHLGYAQRIGTKVLRVPLDETMSIDLDAMAAAVNKNVSMVYLCNPNNPTGKTIDGDVLRNFCRTVGQKVTILVDEAYNELTVDPNFTSMVDLVREGENVIVMRTFSKLYGMAGMRVGYAMGREDLIKKVRNHIMAWPNIVGLAAAHACYNENDFIKFSLGKINQGRNIVREVFEEQGLQPLPSETNFVFADIGRDVKIFEEKMRQENVLVHRAYNLYPNHLRVSMGKIKDLEIFAEVFKKVFRG